MANTSQPAPMPQHAASSSQFASEPSYRLRVMAVVYEATQPGVSEERAKLRCRQLIHIGATSGGVQLQYAIRKRLKDENEQVVLKTISLLTQLMSYCPYFFRLIAKEKFFRRMWQLVVPDYKKSLRSRLRDFGEPKSQRYRPPNPDIKKRVLVLIRAWAEDLSVMFEGRYDLHAGFLIERYNSKRYQTHFPEVPPRSVPWVCPVNTTASGNCRASSYPRTFSQPDSEAVALSEAENVVNLFATLIDNAVSIDDIKDELCRHMANRCVAIQAKLSRCSMNTQEELTRAKVLRVKLERALNDYNASLESGRIIRATPTADRTNVPVEDEDYDEF